LIGCLTVTNSTAQDIEANDSEEADRIEVIGDDTIFNVIGSSYVDVDRLDAGHHVELHLDKRDSITPFFEGKVLAGDSWILIEFDLRQTAQYGDTRIDAVFNPYGTMTRDWLAFRHVLPPSEFEYVFGVELRDACRDIVGLVTNPPW